MLIIVVVLVVPCRIEDHGKRVKDNNFISTCPAILPSILHWFVYPFLYHSIHSFLHQLIYSSIHLFLHQFIYSSIHPSIHPSIPPSTHLFIHPSIHSSINSSIHPSIQLTYPSIHPFLHPTHLFIHPSIYQPACFAAGNNVSSFAFILYPLHPSVNSFIRPSLHPSTLPSIHLSTHPPIHTSIHPPICPSIHPFIHPPASSQAPTSPTQLVPMHVRCQAFCWSLQYTVDVSPWRTV